VLGGLGNVAGAFILSLIISVSGLYVELEWGYMMAFDFLIVMMFVSPQGLLEE
jgi:branched-chain amino acid transport system permease protein